MAAYSAYLRSGEILANLGLTGANLVLLAGCLVRVGSNSSKFGLEGFRSLASPLQPVAGCWVPERTLRPPTNSMVIMMIPVIMNSDFE